MRIFTVHINMITMILVSFISGDTVL